MDTTTLLVVIGCGVLVKTLAFMSFVVRRDRRQRRALAAARAATAQQPRRAAPPAPRPTTAVSRWRLQWAEPGVLLVENASETESVRDVELSATLTTGDGQSASVARHERFVGTGACFSARFTELEDWLSDVVVLDPSSMGERLACSLDLAVVWLGEDGDVHSETRLTQSVVPVPDLVLGTA